MLWHRLRKNKLAMSGAAILLVLYLISSFGGFIGPYGSNEINKYTVKYGPMLLGGYVIEKIAEVIETHGENALIVMDDFPDGARQLYPYLLNEYNTMLRTARHRGTGVFSLQHTYAGNRNTVQALQSNKYVIFFPSTQQNRCIMFMRDHLMMQMPEARELVLRFAALDRYMIIQLHSPVCIFNSKYLLLL